MEITPAMSARGLAAELGAVAANKSNVIVMRRTR